MTRSYYSDERTFQEAARCGEVVLDENADPAASFDRFILRPFLEESLAVLDRALPGLRALEIGCGTGPASCFLAARGLKVRGIDVSPTALEMARLHAARAGLEVQFETADICVLPGQQQERYDLIIDGHCLHCIVSDDHRRSAFAAIHDLLKPDGLLLIESMIAHPDLVVKGNYRIDEQGVLSIRVDEPHQTEGMFELEGEWFAPHRRLRTAEQMNAELCEAGFAVHYQHIRAQSDARKPMLMRIRAGRWSA